MADPHVQNAFQMFKKINVAFIGIGSASSTSFIRHHNILSDEDLANLRSLGAVGETALRFFDANGGAVLSELEEQIIGISLSDLKQIPRVVGMSGGPHKQEVVRAALHGKLIDVLITDHILARHLVDE